MKNLISLIIIFGCITLIDNNLLAVEGYKDFEWNMSVQQVLEKAKQQSFCDLKDLGEDADGIHALSCDNFPFGNQARYGFFLFINDKLLRIGISIERDKVDLLIEIFNEKFKQKPTGSPKVKESVQGGTLGWDNDKVLLKFTPSVSEEQKGTEDEKDSVLITVIYTSKDFGSILKEKRKSILQQAAD